MFRILVCGDRNWTNSQLIRDELLKYNNIELLITGGATGADTIAYNIGEILNLKQLCIPVTQRDWNAYGKAAGPMRNMRMAEEGKPNLVLAFHNDINSSKGTKSMVSIAKKKNIEVKIITE